LEDKKLPTNRLTDWDDEYQKTIEFMKEHSWNETEMCNCLILAKQLMLSDAEANQIAIQTEVLYKCKDGTNG